MYVEIMKVQNFIKIFSFFIGFISGVSIYFCLSSNLISNKRNFAKQFSIISKIPNNFEQFNSSFQYNTSLADKLFDEVKILCLILTQPSQHKSKANHVKSTWGKKCNKFILLSTQNDTDTETFSIPRNESRNILWGKVRNGFEQAYKKYYDDYDWFLKGDDDSYFVMENLRHTLYQYNPKTSIIIGHKYAVQNVKEGYMAGGGYILSKKALQKLVLKAFRGSHCSAGDGGAEDLEMGKCLQEEALFIDGHDSIEEKQFFPVHITDHMNYGPLDYNYWYIRNQWHKSPQGGLECCSKYITCMHYSNTKNMYKFNYLLYNVHPFGLDKQYGSNLPRKLSFDELVKLSDVKSESPNYIIHPFIHRFDDDEKF